MASDDWKKTVADMIADIENMNVTQHNVNTVYSSLCSNIFEEMDRYLPFIEYKRKNDNSPENKHNKSYWNSELKTLWDNMREAGKMFLRCKGN